MQALEAEFRIREAYVALFQTRILSGVYKQRLGSVWHGASDKPENLFTEAELLQDEMSEIREQMCQKENEPFADTGNDIYSG
jgi:hypothetical protein